MRLPTVMIVFSLMVSACKSQPLSQPSSTNKPSSFSLRIDAWRNLMPSIDAEADRSTYCTLEIVLPDSVQPHQLLWQQCCLETMNTAESAWCFEPKKWEWNEEKRLLYTSLGGGPKWRPDTELKATIRLEVNEQAYQQTVENIRLMGTY